MTSPDESVFKPDNDATELDRHLLALGLNLHRAGWTDKAEIVTSSAAYLRETWSQPIGDRPVDLYTAVETICLNAQAIMDVIADTIPDELALRDRGQA